jgi:hypothetical protein
LRADGPGHPTVNSQPYRLGYAMPVQKEVCEIVGKMATGSAIQKEPNCLCVFIGRLGNFD